MILRYFLKVLPFYSAVTLLKDFSWQGRFRRFGLERAGLKFAHDFR